MGRGTEGLKRRTEALAACIGDKGRKDEHREVGYGNLPLADVATAVKSIGFDGIVTVEIVNSQNWTIDEHIAHAIDTSNRCFSVL